MLASKNWVNFNKMFTLSPWTGDEAIAVGTIDKQQRVESWVTTTQLLLSRPGCIKKVTENISLQIIRVDIN